MIGARLRALGWRRQEEPEKPALKEGLEQALDPLSKAIPLSPSEVSRTRKWLIQAGYREERHLTMYVGSRVALAVLGMALVAVTTRLASFPLMVGVGALGFF